MTAWLADFHFLRPIWLLALALLPLLVWQRRRIARRADPWRHVCDPGLLAHLRHAPATQNRASLDARAMGIALVLLILALAGPAFRQAPQAVMRLHAPLVVAVDLSERMRATDLKPDRMSRVRFKLADGQRTRYDRTLTATDEWESSALGAIAIPRAIQRYVTTVQKLVGMLFADPDFIAATRP